MDRKKKNPKGNGGFELPDHLLNIWFYYISLQWAFMKPTTSVFLSLHPSLFPTSGRCLSTGITHPKRNNAVSSGCWQWCMGLMGKHFFSGVVIKKQFFHRPHVKETQRQGPKCNTLISLKLFIGICGALAAGLSPFQLPDLFNSVGNEKCAALLELWSKRLFMPLPPFLPSSVLSLSNRHSHTCSTCFSKG